MSDNEYDQQEFDQDEQQQDQQEQDEEQQDQDQEEFKQSQAQQDVQNETEEDNKSENNQEEEPDIVESEQTESHHDPDEFNLQSVDAISVKIEKVDTNKKKGAKKQSNQGQQKMVQQLLNQHKEKQRVLQKREDDIYVKEQIEKKKPKPQRQIQTKQKLVFDKETKAKLEDQKLGNQEKVEILRKDLGQKLGKPIAENKKIEIKQPNKNEPNKKPEVIQKQKLNQFEVKIGAGIPSKLTEDAESKASRDRVKERNLFLEQKKKEKEDNIKFRQEQDEQLKIKQNNLRKAQEKALDKEVKVLKDNKEKQQEYKNIQQAKLKEKKNQQEEDFSDQLKKEKDIQRSLLREYDALTNKVKSQELEIKQLDKYIKEESKKENVIQINGQYQSLRKIRMKQGIIDIQTQIESQNQSLHSDVGEPDICLKIANKIASKGLELKDAYSLLDEDRDGVLTIKEIQNNIIRLNLNISENEIKQFIAELDKNSDGVLTELEFISHLTPQVNTQKDYIRIMGNIQDILNPIILEERRLHIKYLQKYLVKEIESENQIQQKQLPKYQKYVKKLKQTEKFIDALKGTTSDKGLINSECQKLRDQLRQIQEKRNKILNQYQAKRETIQKVIDELTEDLGNKCQFVLDQKEKLNNAQTQSQRLELTLLSLKQMKSRYEKELDIKNEIERNVARAAVVVEAMKNQQAEAVQQKQIKQQQEIQIILTVQKCVRRFICMRKYKKKQKYSKEFAKLLLELCLKKIKSHQLNFLNQIEQIHLTFKQQEYEKKQIYEQRQQELRVQQFRDKRESIQRFITNQMKTLTPTEELLKQLPQIITIQKIFRLKNKGQAYTNQAINVSFGIGNYNENCQICERDLGEKICKKCDKPIQCDSCFKLVHKTYRKKNHEFFIIMKREVDNNQDFKQFDVFQYGPDEIKDY